ncbi:hypothetical protein [Nocardioides mangrovicus]|nr:hypothetical protein [Nocardioides mangrovicus]
MQSLVVAPLDITEGAGAWPIVIGGAVLLVLVAAMLVLLAIGKGREHS